MMISKTLKQMKINRHYQAEFYGRQLQKQEEDYQQYMKTDAFALYQSNRLFAGVFVGVDKTRGNVLVRFKNSKTPRQKMLYTAFTVRRPPSRWRGMKYGFLQAEAESGLKSDARSVYFAPYREDPEWIVVGFNRVDLQLVSMLEKDAIVVFAEHEPPWKYLDALQHYATKLPGPDPVLDMEVGGTPDYHPDPLQHDDHPIDTLRGALDADGEVLLQGPPGTGKTYLMAELCAQYLLEGKSVCVTALTNRALMELAGKTKFTQPFLDRKAIHKTSLSADEQKKLPGLQRLDEIAPMPGKLVLSTYYMLSTAPVELLTPNEGFDLVIIEEASQAFLGTLGLFRRLGKQVVVVGDPQQLPPIWDEKYASNLGKHIRWVAEGLQAYANFFDVRAFQLTDTFRLPPRAAEATGGFYQYPLRSVAEQKKPFGLELPAEVTQHLHPEGGVSILPMPMTDAGRLGHKVLPWLKRFLRDFETRNPDKHIAILSPLRNINQQLQGALYPSCKRLQKVEIETIDRIQGMTTDFTILLLPAEGSNFALKLNRFNVATSRSRSHTLILMDEALNRHIPDCHPKVKQFLTLIEA
ncbi:AAA domain-containing protein [Phaeodactylibacter xiamenensis]|uniref:AAA domain-containing protein n=1 Tax=Phaeodactylibacter xiamenensis TaxID=1524460 RepID=UPI0024A869FD|nr:AAA domain-containing protein [Phaeodactylibacter xiamenensis]